MLAALRAAISVPLAHPHAHVAGVRSPQQNPSLSWRAASECKWATRSLVCPAAHGARSGVGVRVRASRGAQSGENRIELSGVFHLDAFLCTRGAQEWDGPSRAGSEGARSATCVAAGEGKKTLFRSGHFSWSFRNSFRYISSHFFSFGLSPPNAANRSGSFPRTPRKRWRTKAFCESVPEYNRNFLIFTPIRWAITINFTLASYLNRRRSEATEVHTMCDLFRRPQLQHFRRRLWHFSVVFRHRDVGLRSAICSLSRQRRSHGTWLRRWNVNEIHRNWRQREKCENSRWKRRKLLHSECFPAIETLDLVSHPRSSDCLHFRLHFYFETLARHKFHLDCFVQEETVRTIFGQLNSLNNFIWHSDSDASR